MPEIKHPTINLLFNEMNSSIGHVDIHFLTNKQVMNIIILHCGMLTMNTILVTYNSVIGFVNSG